MLDADPDDLAYVVKVAQKIAKTAMSVFAADGLMLVQFNEPASGQTVYHLHVHVIPRQDGVPLRPPASYKEEPSVLAEQAAKLAAALKGA
jgi:histidine triad (HIT) family protein